MRFRAIDKASWSMVGCSGPGDSFGGAENAGRQGCRVVSKGSHRKRRRESRRGIEGDCMVVILVLSSGFRQDLGYLHPNDDLSECDLWESTFAAPALRGAVCVSS